MKNCKVCNSECDGVGFSGMIDGVCFRCALAEYSELKIETNRLHAEIERLRAIIEKQAAKTEGGE